MYIYVCLCVCVLVFTDNITCFLVLQYHSISFNIIQYHSISFNIIQLLERKLFNPPKVAQLLIWLVGVRRSQGDERRYPVPHYQRPCNSINTVCC